ncbi:hypothetical protein CLPUN_29130 [Clostridium puniceum]|uniref:CobQ/CobB/MinD/ParA nucleotide binding domain protein n=1 Tax=Clostridium puniceum TaxID=29367 RepID=A0A1S8TDT9_9CLOT|nr:hypothetical protein [Clostridium puniceum]OOM75876.1 hypothetical protein CLPUN_29130 [Clostridium puniceum]
MYFSVIANKVRNEKELDLIKDYLKDMELLSSMPYSNFISIADLKGKSPTDLADDSLIETVDFIISKCSNI